MLKDLYRVKIRYLQELPASVPNAPYVIDLDDDNNALGQQNHAETAANEAEPDDVQDDNELALVPIDSMFTSSREVTGLSRLHWNHAPFL